MIFDKILEYQAIDQELFQIEAGIRSSEENQRKNAAKARRDSEAEAVGKLRTEAAGLLSGFAALRERLETLQAELDEFDGILEGVQDVTEADHYLKRVSAIADNIAALEKQISAAQVKIDRINEDYKKTWEQGVKANDAFTKAKADYDALVKQYQPKAAEIQQKLESLKPDIAPKALEIYQTLRKARRMPAIVPYDAAGGRCSRCRMELASDTKSKLREVGDYAECPNCGRILYVPEN